MAARAELRRRLDQFRAGGNLSPLVLDDINVRLQHLETLLMAQQRLPLDTLDMWLKSFVLTIPSSTPAGKEVSVSERVPFDGRIKEVVLHFPSGPQGLAGVFFTIEGEQVFPPLEGETIALDDTTIPYQADIYARKGDVIKLNGNNTDAVNSHTIRAQVVLFEEPEGTKVFG